MIKYKLTIAYDGTDFFGWQIQPSCISIVQALQNSFELTFGQKVSVLGASRTDGGVHALGQVAGFKIDFNLNVEQMKNAWNNRLPSTIVIRSIERAQPDFHPFYGIQYKTYYYHFFMSRPLPFLERYGWYYKHEVNVDQLKAALQLFVGTHNFKSFSAGPPISNNPICTIQNITCEYIRRFNVYRIAVTGNRFLHNMVRRIVGGALVVATPTHASSYKDIENLLQVPNSNNSLPTAPAKGLLLYKIKYK